MRIVVKHAIADGRPEPGFIVPERLVRLGDHAVDTGSDARE